MKRKRAKAPATRPTFQPRTQKSDLPKQDPEEMYQQTEYTYDTLLSTAKFMAALGNIDPNANMPEIQEALGAFDDLHDQLIALFEILHFIQVAYTTYQTEDGKQKTKRDNIKTGINYFLGQQEKIHGLEDKLSTLADALNMPTWDRAELNRDNASLDFFAINYAPKQGNISC